MVVRTVDLHSDTVTKPTEMMRAAMANAEVEDDVLCSDPNACHLETKMAKITGKEAALFVPSGTMGNLISVLVHCEIKESEVILGNNCHIHKAVVEEECKRKHKGLTVMDTPVEGRERLEALKDIEDHFYSAYESGQNVSRMLEANRMQMLSGFEEIKENSNKLI